LPSRIRARWPAFNEVGTLFGILAAKPVNMKKLILGVAACTVAFTASAQMNIGGKAGLNYSSYGTKVDPEPEEKPEAATGIGFHVGGYLEFMFSDKVGIRPELLFSARKTSDTETSTTTFDLFGTTTTAKTESDNKTTFSYLELPILLNYKLSDNFSFQVGPGFGLLMSAKNKFDATTTTTTTTGGSSTTTTTETSGDSDSKEGLRGLELGAVAGINYELESGLSVGLRYWRGLSTLNEETDFGGATVKTNANVLQVSVGYAFLKN
jgi:hypothetical protein